MNPVIVPDDVDHFSEISEAQVLNIHPKIPEFFQDFLSVKSFSETGKNIFKYICVSKNLASRLIFMTIFSLSPVFSKKYEHLPWESITTRAKEKKTTRKSKKFESR